VIDIEGEASLRGHLKAEGAEETGSQSYVPPNEKDDRALKEAFDLLRGTSGRSIQAKGIEPDIKVLQEIPGDLKARGAGNGALRLTTARYFTPLDPDRGSRSVTRVAS
jgi:hypothetical protein